MFSASFSYPNCLPWYEVGVLKYVIIEIIEYYAVFSGSGEGFGHFARLLSDEIQFHQWVVYNSGD